ncbi:MAG: hypothetical protein HYS15_00590 [Candidatus Spechtbacteria bacterium]|nr:hypothetical protein [Candidatus Spechtbacteria bacterium]
MKKVIAMKKIVIGDLKKYFIIFGMTPFFIEFSRPRMSPLNQTGST